MANVQDDWRDAFTAKHKSESFEDFAHLISLDAFQTSLRSLIDEVPGLKDNRLVLAGFMEAWQYGSSAAPSSAAKDDPNDVH